MDSSLTGAYGELITGRYLRDMGFRIAHANFRTRFGEIDLIAENGESIVFCEVKTRSSHGAISAADAVDIGKRKRITLTAQKYISLFEARLQPCFDVCEIYLDGYAVTEFNYIKNAYTLD